MVEKRVKEWLKDTSDALDISSFSLKEWPDILKGKENLIERFNCCYNQLTSLPDLPNCMILVCYNNRLTSLRGLPKCELLWCSGNQLTSLRGFLNVRICIAMITN